MIYIHGLLLKLQKPLLCRIKMVIHKFIGHEMIHKMFWLFHWTIHHNKSDKIIFKI